MDDTTQRLWREHARLTPAIIERTIISEDGDITGVSTIPVPYAVAAKRLHRIMESAERAREVIAQNEADFQKRIAGIDRQELGEMLNNIVGETIRATRGLIIEQLAAIAEQMPDHPRDAYWVRQGWFDAIQEIRNG